jgi:D-alanyl-D-alanine carboxypeptidase
MPKTFQTLNAAIFVAVCASAFAQEPAGSSSPSSSTTLSATATGRRVEAYLKAFNSGQESAMREFFLTNVADSALKTIPIEPRLNRYLEMHTRAGSFTLRKVVEVTADRARIVVETAQATKFRMEFQFEKTEPHKLLTIGLDEAGPEDEGIARLKNLASVGSAVEEYVSKLAQADEFSGVVLIAKNGSPIFQKACGYANKEQRVLNTMETRFNLGSINKTFTQLAIHQLAAAHKLAMSDPIGKFLSDYPNRQAAEKVTIQQLLEMTSGVGDFFGERYDATPKEKLATIADYLPLFAHKPLEFAPGTRRRYSNGGYIVLGAIIEKISGIDYYSYVRTNIFLPAKMTRTGSFPKTFTEPDIAYGYSKMAGQGSAPGKVRQRNTWMLPQRGSSAGGGYSTAGDLLKYTVALQSGGLAPASFDAANGFGIAGGTEGVNAALDWDPNRGYAVIVLSNYDPPAAENAARHIRALLPEN